MTHMKKYTITYTSAGSTRRRYTHTKTIEAAGLASAKRIALHSFRNSLSDPRIIKIEKVQS